ncbi:response regulator transcription factor [Nocardioidaceae bacterium]|nr:response regulator transcription factor [Nocardioidaceae bacterium]
MLRRVSAIRVAIVNDYELVVQGLAAMLGRFGDRIDVVEVDSRMRVVSDVDIALYDTFGQPQGAELNISDVVTPGSATKVVVYSWNHDPDLVEASFEAGAAGYVEKSVSGADLVDRLERVHAGEQVRPQVDQHDTVDGDVGDWPGQQHGLTPRESEVLALICQGFSNDHICSRTYITLNTLKGYIRNLYRKIGVDDRPNAILWGVDHGFRPDRVRRIDT